MEMKKKKEKVTFFSLLKLAVLHPKLYSKTIPLEGNFKSPLTFFLIVFASGSLIHSLIYAISVQNLTLVFLGISGTVFALPFAILVLFLISGALFLLSKLLSGKGSFKTSVYATAYSLVYLIFFGIPFIDVVAYLLMLFCLTLAFQRAQQYSIVKASINVAIPFLITLILSVILGLLNSQGIITS